MSGVFNPFMPYGQEAGGRWKNFEVGDVIQPFLWKKYGPGPSWWKSCPTLYSKQLLSCLLKEAEDDLSGKLQLFCCFSALPSQRRHFIPKHWGDTSSKQMGNYSGPFLERRSRGQVSLRYLFLHPNSDCWMSQPVTRSWTSSLWRISDALAALPRAESVAQGMQLVSAC